MGPEVGGNKKMEININYKLMGLRWNKRVVVKKIDNLYHYRLSDRPDIEYTCTEEMFYIVLKNLIEEAIKEN